MRPLAVFYHCKISGDGIPDPQHAYNVMLTQMSALNKSGLADAASLIVVGVNGTDCDAFDLSTVVPEKSQIVVHGPHVKSEIPTQMLIEHFVRQVDGWYVLYHHTKGVTHPNEALYDRWRERMENACIWNWQKCVADLDGGYEAVGCHWLTPEKYPAAVTSPFFGGTFWWTTTKYLKQLPKLPAPTWENRFEAESWIGRRRPYPRINDYYPGWP